MLSADAFRKLDDNSTQEKDVHGEIFEYTDKVLSMTTWLYIKLAQMWPNNIMQPTVLKQIYGKQKAKAKDQSRQDKDSTSESKKQSISDRRKKKTSAEQTTPDNNTVLTQLIPQISHNNIANIDLNAVGE